MEETSKAALSTLVSISYYTQPGRITNLDLDHKTNTTNLSYSYTPPNLTIFPTATTSRPNMYEEENSPFAQRRKFLEQLAFRHVDGEGDGRPDIDESYLEALEWGLPPTGGWGLGVDRLVMLFTGQKRIGDVLPFGTLRNVVGLAARQT